MTLAMCMGVISAQAQGQGHFKVRKDNYIHIGYDKDKALTFGKGRNGLFALESFDGGLNIFRPWPEPNAGNYKFFINKYGSVSINGKYSGGWYQLQVHGRAYFTVYSKSPTHWTTSDKRFKSNITPIQNSLDRVLKLNGYAYTLKPPQHENRFQPESKDMTIDQAQRVEQDKLRQKETTQNPPQQQIGFVAQELKELFPRAVKTDEDGSLMVNYNAIIPVLVEAIKEQQKRIEALERNQNK